MADKIVNKSISYLIPHLKTEDIKTYQALFELDQTVTALVDSTNLLHTTAATSTAGDVTPTPTNPNYVAPVTIVSADVILLKDTINIGIVLTYVPHSVKHKGVHLYLEIPDSSSGPTVKVNTTPINTGIIQGRVLDLGLNNSIIKDNTGRITIIVYTNQPLPKEDQPWRLYVQAVGDNYDPAQVAANLVNPTVSIVIKVLAVSLLSVGEEYSPNVTDATIVLPIEVKFFQSSWHYRATIIWTDPDPIKFPTTIFRFAGVEVSVLDITKLNPEDIQFANPFGVDPTSRIRIGKGITKWISEWIEIPSRIETYEVRLPAYDILGQVNTISALVTPLAIFDTPDLLVVRASMMTSATGVSVVAGYGYQPGTGNFDLILTPIFTRAQDTSVSYYGFVVKLASGYWTLLGFPSVGDGITDDDRAYINGDSYPKTTELWIGLFVSFDVNGAPKYPDVMNLDALNASGTIPNFGDSPTCIFTVYPQAQALGSGFEYAPLVTNIFGGVYYRQSVDGIETFGFQGFYDTPIDGTDRYQGLIPTVVFLGGAQPVPLLITGKDEVNFKTPEYPLAASSGMMYFLSKDANGRTNSIVDGVTPAIAFIVNPQTTGNIDISRGNPASLGNGVQITTSGGRKKLQVKIKNGSLVADVNGIELGVIPDVSKFAAGIRPVSQFAVNPALPDTNYPIGSYGFNTTTKALLRVNDFGNAWKSGVDTADMALNSVVVGIIAAGTVRSTELASDEIRVGGGGGKPGRFGVYNSTNALIGYIGTNGADEGGWFKETGIGGSSFATAGLISDSVGNILLRNTNIQLNLNGVTTYIQNDADTVTGGHGIKIVDTIANTTMVLTQKNLSCYASSGLQVFQLYNSVTSGGNRPVFFMTNVLSGGGLTSSINIQPNQIAFGTGIRYTESGINISGATQAGPVNTTGTLADVSSKFNALLTILRNLGIIS